ncbi:hypothetical protein CBS101457_001141 [Exobasidium rhododendri]|nr:hypothetical protein CBS101457_001141 [Exobasidium rhododendri]
MSNFFSLDDEDDVIGEPSDEGAQIDQGSRESTSRIHGDGTRSHLDIGRNGAIQNEAPVKQLQRAWITERAAPEILSWKGIAVDDVCSQIEEQMTIIESLASDASTAEEEHIRLGLVELDVERARWLLKSYIRCRLDKIEQHATFLQEDAQSRQKMSDLERGYCVKFTQLQSQHYQMSVLDFLPANLRSLHDKAESGSDGRGDMGMS